MWEKRQRKPDRQRHKQGQRRRKEECRKGSCDWNMAVCTCHVYNPDLPFVIFFLCIPSFLADKTSNKGPPSFKSRTKVTKGWYPLRILYLASTRLVLSFVVRSCSSIQRLAFQTCGTTKVTLRCVYQSARSTVEYCMGYNSPQHFLTICSYYMLHPTTFPTACSCLTLLLLRLHGLLHFTEFAHIIVHLSRSTRCKIAISCRLQIRQ